MFRISARRCQFAAHGDLYATGTVSDDLGVINKLTTPGLVPEDVITSTMPYKRRRRKFRSDGPSLVMFRTEHALECDSIPPS